MKNALNEILDCPFSRLLGFATALVLLVAPAIPAAEAGAAAPKLSAASPPVQWGTNVGWQVSGEFHDIDFDNVPLGEVVTHLQKLYGEQFDVLIPNAGIDSGTPAPVDPATGLSVPTESIDARAIPVRMRLKNVTAPEVFQAMNTLFEIDCTPARWDLVMNGNRPVAVLRPGEFPSPVPPPPPAPPGQRTTGQGGPTPDQPVQRIVLYVGDLTGDPGMSLDSILKTLTATLEETFSPPRSKLQCHAAAELLIASGPAEEIGFVREVIGALEQKVNADRQRTRGLPAADPKPDRLRP